MKSLVIILFVVYCAHLCQCSPQIGGLKDENPSDENYLKLATAGIGKVDQFKGEKCARQIRKVVNVKSQLVAGKRYLMDVEICTPEACKEQSDPVCHTCTLDLWEKSWENFLQATKLECPTMEKWNYNMLTSN